jgi:hypothetical protein
MNHYLAMYLLCGLCFMLPLTVLDRDKLDSSVSDLLGTFFVAAIWPIAMMFMILDGE